MPNTIKGDEKQAICQEFEGVSTFNSQNTDCSYDDLQGYSMFSILLVFILVVGIIVFSVLVVYYNVYVRKSLLL